MGMPDSNKIFFVFACSVRLSSRVQACQHVSMLSCPPRFFFSLLCLVCTLQSVVLLVELCRVLVAE